MLKGETVPGIKAAVHPPFFGLPLFVRGYKQIPAIRCLIQTTAGPLFWPPAVSGLRSPVRCV